MDRADITLVTGVTVVVQGDLDEIERKVQDAARQQYARLVWLTDDSDASIGINPVHIVSVRPHPT